MSDKQWVFDNHEEAAELIEQQQAIIANLESELTAVKHENHALATWKDKTEALAASVVMCQGTIQDKTMTEMLKISAERDAEVLLKLADYMEEGFGMPITMGCDDVREYADSVKRGKA